MDLGYSVSVVRAVARPIAAVRARMRIADVPSKFGALLGQVYAAARAHAITLDGQNVFVYRELPSGDFDIEFGVGVAKSFGPVDAVVSSETPSGAAATTTHWGDYGGLGAAHAAVVAWCKENGRRRAGPVWEVYGHWTDDPASLRTDVYHLLEPNASGS